MPPRIRPRAIEDPNNTWNSQLMRACLRNDISEADKVVCNGADPSAPEPVSFYHDPLPPLLALLLRGSYTEECIATMRWLVERGASVSQVVPIRDKDDALTPVEQGTILHLVVQMGQAPLLLGVLALVGHPRPLPVSFMRRIQRLDLGAVGISTPTGTCKTVSPPSSSHNQSNQHKKHSIAVQNKRLGRRASRVGIHEQPYTQHMNLLNDINPHLDGVLIDFGVRSSVNGWTAMDLALQRKDATAVELLLYYGAPCTFQRLVNASQTALARACSQGDKELVEALLDAGDDLWHVSMDGRYTLIHYAVAHPPVLDTLLTRGLAIDAENALGETALISLICYGQGCNSESAIRDAMRPLDATRLSTMPLPALKNYILTPQAQGPATTSGKHTKANNVPAGADVDYPAISRDADAWWYFLPSNATTWELIQTLCERGADVHGTPPASNVDKLVERAKENKQIAVSAQHNEDCSGTVSSWILPDFTRGTTAPSFPTSPATSGDDGETSMSPLLGMHVSSDALSKQQLDTQCSNLRPTIQQVVRLTPLMHAIVAYHPDLIRRFIMEYKVDPMVQDPQGACALHYAATALHPSVMELLLSHAGVNTDRKCDINIQDCCGRTPLHHAAMHGNASVVRALLNCTASNSNNNSTLSGIIIQPSKTDYAGRTALHLAVLFRQLAIVEILLRHTESAAATSNGESTILMQCTTSSVGKRRNNRTGSGVRRKWRQPAYNEPSLCDPLTQPIDVDAKDTATGFTALEMAVHETRDVEAARLLLSVGVASVRHPSGLPSGGTLLHRTVVEGMLPMMRLLLEYYAEPNDVDNLEQTPLHLATRSKLPNAVDMVRELLNCMATVEVQSGHTLETPLIVAARRGDADMVDLLLHHRCDNLSGRRPGQAGTRRHRLRSAAYCTSNNTTLSSSTPPNTVGRAGGLGASLQSRSRQSVLLLGKPGERLKKSTALQPVSRRSGRPQQQGTKGQNSARLGQQKQQKMINRDTSTSSISDEDCGLWGNTHGTRVDVGDINIAAVMRGGDAALEISGSSLESDGISVQHGLTINIHHLLSADGHVRTALHHLCSHSDPDLQRKLLPHICDILHCQLAQTLVLQVDETGRLPLHDACAAGFTGAVKELLACDTGNTAFFVDMRGCLPMHYAVVADSVGCLSELLTAVEASLPCQLCGTSAEVEDPRMIPIVQRIISSQRDMRQCKAESKIERIKSRSLFIDTVREYLNVFDGMGRTPLLLAAELGRCQVSQYLVNVLVHEASRTRKDAARTPILHGTHTMQSSSSSQACNSMATACMQTGEYTAAREECDADTKVVG
uniref:Ankyrin repeat protein n=1 Tax=Trypanosoma congolense (strain IL3000) TaxID=1068625 RepID=G0UQV9_TRYCI|nr:conserved hypothetical protein [Trypanosoma congolense IL3000]